MISFNHLTFTYPGTERPALRDVSLTIPAGEIALVVGRSGSGKSTLLRCINGLVPHFSGGVLQGEIRVAGLDPVKAAPKVMSRHVGFVFQDPEAQFVVDRVEDEIAFALENLAVPHEEMQERVSDVLALLDLTSLRERRLETLSGGERQRVAIAAALVLRPQVLVLDEPTSQLDPGGAEEVLQALLRLNRSLGLTIVLVEHRLERVMPFIDRLIHLDEQLPGVIAGSPREVLRQIDLNSPLVTLAKARGWEPLPLTIEEAQEFVITEKSFTDHAAGNEKAISATGKGKQEAFIHIDDLVVYYGSIAALQGVSLDLYPGEIAVLMGPNGAGKTTLLRTLIGLQKPDRGHVLVHGEDIARLDVAEVSRTVAYLPQDPNALLFSDTVLDELVVTLHNHYLASEGNAPTKKWDQIQAEAEALSLLSQLGLEDKARQYPRDLSAGERQRVALGAVMVVQPGALLLDEPTRGLDYAAKERLAELLVAWRDQGAAILLVTHDVELVANTAQRVILMEAGKITADGDPADVLGKSQVFAPQMARLYPDTGWLTVTDVLDNITPRAG
jgi:energy-coupling factor transporter ATP-binding protein EcfA2